MPLELLSDWPGDYEKGAIQIRNLEKKLESCTDSYERSCLMVDFKHDMSQVYSAKLLSRQKWGFYSETSQKTIATWTPAPPPPPMKMKMKIERIETPNPICSLRHLQRLEIGFHDEESDSESVPASESCAVDAESCAVESPALCLQNVLVSRLKQCTLARHHFLRRKGKRKRRKSQSQSQSNHLPIALSHRQVTL